MMPADFKTAGVSGYVSMEYGGFLLADAAHLPAIFCDSADWPGVLRAVDDLRADIGRITGREVLSASQAANANILVGTLGRSETIDSLVISGRLDSSAIAGKWECFLLQVVDGRLVIAGSDQRGTIFGIYDLCQKIGVSPWYWWADVASGHADQLYLNLDEPYIEGEPQVRYRGIFINDEYAFDNWAMQRGDTQLVDTYQRVFELLLRLKANTLWPAMHMGSPPFHQDLHNPENAARYGIVIGTSHCEQLLRCNEQEYLPFEQDWICLHPDKPLYKKKLPDSPCPCAYVWTETDPDTGEAVWNKELLMDYWREGVTRFGRYESIFTMGMRGLHDAGWQPVRAEAMEEKAAQMEEIIAIQRDILSDVLGKPAEEIPQLLIPYKEIQEIYDSGMTVPEDVTLMWSDDNFGYLRRTPAPEEKSRSGGAGIYYHAGYHGDPNSYIWMSNVPLALIREELGRAYDDGADRIWILNVGDLKPAETQMEYFLDLARRTDEVRRTGIRDWLAQKARRDFSFGYAEAAEYAGIMTRFHQLVFSRKPEHFRPALFSLEACGDEGQRYLDEYQTLLRRTEMLEQAVNVKDQSAYFELLAYPLRSSANTAAKYIFADRSLLYAKQGRGGCVNQYSTASQGAYWKIVEDTRRYNTMLNGKWSLMMDPFQPAFQKRGAKLSNYLPVGSVAETGFSDLALFPEESMSFSHYQRNRRFIDLCNTGSGYVDWRVENAPAWIKFSAISGTVMTDFRLWLGVDWDKAPQGRTETDITFTWMNSDKIWQCQNIGIQLNAEKYSLPPGTWLEENHVISIIAVRAVEWHPGRRTHWDVEPDLGREYDVLRVSPAQDVAETTDSAVAVYHLWFTSTGRFPLEVRRLPTLNEQGQQRIAISIDGQPPIVLYGNSAAGTQEWAEGVLCNSQALTTEITIESPGPHILRIYGIDPGVLVEKIVIYTGSKPYSYFGPPASYCSPISSKLQRMRNDTFGSAPDRIQKKEE